MNIPGKKNNLKLDFFSQYFWPEDFRINEVVKYFLDKKYNIEIYTTHPSYPNKNNFLYYYKKKKNYKEYQGIKIKRFYTYPRAKSNISIILSYITFFTNSFFYTFYNFLFKKSDFLFIFCPSPILTAIPGVILGKIFKRKIILWVLDLWPNTVIDLHIVKNKFIIKIFNFLVKYIYNNSDLILAQSNSFVNEIKKITNSKCIYFPSWPETNIHLEVKRCKEMHKDRRIKILFAGNIGEAQAFDSIINCANILKEKKIAKWIVVGDGRWKKKLENLIFKNNLEKDFQIIKRVPQEKVGSLLNNADLLLVTLKKNATFKKTIPGKLPTYMSAGKPVLGMISGEANKIIKEARCGFACEADDYKKLSKLILNFSKLTTLKKKKLGKQGLNYVKKNFNKLIILENLEKSLININI
jgi:glycosyltransferase involved in cell wall biosynthesis